MDYVWSNSERATREEKEIFPNLLKFKRFFVSNFTAAVMIGIVPRSLGKDLHLQVEFLENKRMSILL